MGRKRNIYVEKRPLEDMTRLDCVTTKVKPVAVLQDNYEYATILQSCLVKRQPYYLDEFAKLRQEFKAFEPTIYHIPADCKYCGQCGEPRKRDRFSPDSRHKDGLKSNCKACCAENERRRYWLTKQQVSFALN